MRRCLILYGLTCVVALTLLAREIAFLFSGAELILLIALGAWLLLTGAGCGLLGRLAAVRSAGATSFAFLMALFGLLAPLTLLLIRFVPAVSAPQRDSVLQAILVCFCALLPIGLAGGILLALALTISLRRAERASAAAVESAGFIVAGAFLGGLLSAYLLTDLRPMQILAGIAALHCLTGFFVWFNAPRRTELGWLLIPLALTCAVLAATIVGPLLDILSQAWLHPGRVWQSSTETAMGRVKVLKTSVRIEYYLNGALVGAQGDAATVERRTLAALLAHPAPRRVLILSATPDDSIAAALKLSWLQVDYLPLDGDAARAAVRHAPEALRKAFEQPRVRLLWDLDPELFIQAAAGRYDVVCMSVPADPPGSLSRYMTARFFSQARRAAGEGGLFALWVSGSGDSPDAAAVRTGSALISALSSRSATLYAFRADSGVLLLNYPRRGAPPPQPAELAGRMARWNVRGTALRESDIARLLDRSETAKLAATLGRAPLLRAAGQSSLPWRIAATSWARSLNAQGLDAATAALSFDMFSVLLIAVLMCIALALWGQLASGAFNPVLPAALVCSAGSAAAAAVAGFLALQAKCGTVLPEFGLLAGTGVVGVGVGALLAARKAGGEGDGRSAALLLMAQALASVFGGVVCLLIVLMGPVSSHLVGICMLSAITGTGGALAGAHLPLLISPGVGNGEPSASQKTLNAFGLACAGGGAAAFLCGVALAPSLGAAHLAFAAALLSLVPLPLIVLSFRRQGGSKRGYRQSSGLYIGAAQQARTTYPGSVRQP